MYISIYSLLRKLGELGHSARRPKDSFPAGAKSRPALGSAQSPTL